MLKFQPVPVRSAGVAAMRMADASSSLAPGAADPIDGGGFGCVVARHFGLSDAPSLVARPARQARLGISRLACDALTRQHGSTMAAEDSFVVVLHLADYREAALWSQRGRPLLAASHPTNSITIVNLMDDVAANVAGPLDVLSFYIPRATLDGFTDEAECRRVVELVCRPAQIDPVLANLGAALLPALAHPEATNPLVVDRIGMALQAHLAAAYGGLTPPMRRNGGGLTGLQAARAKQYLVGTEASELSLAGAAATCGLSRSYFSKAFKATTGKSPHRWLLEHRIDHAKRLLRTSSPIAEIAIEAGFTDQSHFTRVFTHMVGHPPGAWRRNCRS